MPTVYSTYEAKAKFSEVMRKVRRGQSVRISYRGREVAEIRPIDGVESSERTWDRLVEQGLIEPAADTNAPMETIADRPGALARFLASRD